MKPETVLSSPSDAEPGSPLLDLLLGIFPRAAIKPAAVRKRSFLYRQGDPIAAIHCVIEGSVAVERLDEEGRLSMFGIMGPGAILGWQDLMANGVHRNAAEALSPCEVVAIPCGTFSAAMHRDVRLVEMLMRQGAEQLSAYEDHMVRLSTLELSKRIYMTLCSFVDDAVPRQGTVDITVPLLKKDLAALLGTSPESLSRSLRRLEDMQIAEFRGRNVVRLRLGWGSDAACGAE
ncbi:MAG: Crp/Fnr family transcriptional regulator [Solirubrobacterales bacterium]